MGEAMEGFQQWGRWEGAEAGLWFFIFPDAHLTHGTITWGWGGEASESSQSSVGWDTDLTYSFAWSFSAFITI